MELFPLVELTPVQDFRHRRIVAEVLHVGVKVQLGVLGGAGIVVGVLALRASPVALLYIFLGLQQEENFS